MQHNDPTLRFPFMSESHMRLSPMSEWSQQSTDEVARATAEVLRWAYGMAAHSQATQRLFEAMDDLDLEAATIWKRVLGLLGTPETAGPDTVTMNLEFPDAPLPGA